MSVQAETFRRKTNDISAVRFDGTETNGNEIVQWILETAPYLSVEVHPDPDCDYDYRIVFFNGPMHGNHVRNGGRVVKDGDLFYPFTNEQFLIAFQPATDEGISDGK